MARLRSFFSNLGLRQNPISFQGATAQIGARNLSFDQFNRNSEDSTQIPRNPDGIFVRDRIFGISRVCGSSEELMENSPNSGENLADNRMMSVGEIAKEVSSFIRTRPRWEQTLLSDFPTVNFRDPIVYNAVLKQQSNLFLSLRFYFWLRSVNGSSFDPLLANVIFGRLVEAKCAHAAKDFLDDTNFEPEPSYLELYIRCLCENGLIDEAIKVFERLKTIGHCVPLETWNWALLHSVRTKRVDVVWVLYEDMTKYGIVTDVETIGHLIQAFCLEGNVLKGYEILQQVLKAGHIPDKIVFDKLISAFGKNHNHAKVSAVLNNMIAKNCSPDIYTYQEIIKSFGEGNMTYEGFRIFNELKDRGYFPDRVMYTTMIHILSRNKDLGGARKMWFEMIRYGLVPNEYTYNAYINGLFRSGHIDEAEKLHREMIDRGYRETTISFNTRINGLCMNGKVKQAQVLFEEMNEKGIARDSITYNSMIRGFCKLGEITQATYFFNELLKQGFQLSTASLSSLIAKLCSAGRVKEAETMWLDMRDRGWKPAVHSLEPIISGLSKQGHFAEMMNWFGYMINHGVRPGKKTLENLIKRLSGAHRLDDAFIVLHHMLKMGFPIREIICHSLVNKLCRDNSHDVETLIGKILERTVDPKHGFSLSPILDQSVSQSIR